MDACIVATDGVEYTTPSRPADEMVWYIPHHFVRGKAALPSATECYGIPKLTWPAVVLN